MSNEAARQLSSEDLERARTAIQVLSSLPLPTTAGNRPDNSVAATSGGSNDETGSRLGILEKCDAALQSLRRSRADNGGKRKKKPLTSEKLKALIDIKFSDRGSSRRPVEEATYIHFVDFMDECADEEIGCRLEDILIFFTGADCVPPMGFEKYPSLTFIHDAKAVLPTASTCDLQLRLPTCFREYDDFKEHILLEHVLFHPRKFYSIF